VSNGTTNSKNHTALISPETTSSISKNQLDNSSTKIKLNSKSTFVTAPEIKTNLKAVHSPEKRDATTYAPPIVLIEQEHDILFDALSTNEETGLNVKDHVASEVETPIELTIAENPIQHPANQLTKTDEISTLSIVALDVLTRELSLANPVKVPVKKNNNFTLSIMQGYGWSSMDISSNNEEWQPVITEWQGKIKSLENIETNIEATIRLPKGIQLGAGFQYSILTTQLEYQQTTSEDFSEEGIIAVIIDEDDSQHNLYGDVNVNRQTIIQSTRFTTHNRLNLVGLVSVPVFRSYRSETGLWVKGGYNLSYKSEGTTFSPNGEPLRFSTQDSPYTLQSPFTFAVGIGTIYRINKHWTLNARAGYEPLRYTHGLYNDQIVIHHSIFSLSLGAGYTF